MDSFCPPTCADECTRSALNLPNFVLAKDNSIGDRASMARRRETVGVMKLTILDLAIRNEDVES